MEEILTVYEAAKWMNVSIDVIYDMVKAKQMPHFRVGRLIRFHRDDVRAWMGKKTAPQGDRETLLNT